MTKIVTRKIVPSAPGFAVVQMCDGDEGHPDTLIEFPIVAWEVTCERDDDDEDATSEMANAHPITVCWATNMAPNTHPVIRHPDGKFTVPGDCSLPDEAGAFKYFRELRDAAARREALRKEQRASKHQKEESNA